jgi:hypothetical protein
MLTRRRFVGYSALSSALFANGPLLRSAFGQTTGKGPLRLAILGSVYREGSALQTIADRFMVGYPYEGEWHMPEVKVVSLYVDQRIRKVEAGPNEFQKAMSGNLRAAWLRPTPGVPALHEDQRRVGEKRAQVTAPPPPPVPPLEELGPMSDLSEARAKQFGFRLCRNIPEALRCGGNRLAVDAVLTVIEDDEYPRNDRGQILLPNYDFFQQCAHVFESEGRSVPYFNHKQLSFSYTEAQEMVKIAERLKFPLLAGASMPVTWRLPDTDVPFGAKVQEAVMVGVGSLQGTGFDALEAMQCMLERRKGGETGVKAVQLLEGDDVWAAASAGRWSKDLLSSALSRSDTPLGLTWLDGRTQDLTAPGLLPQLVKDPAAVCVEYTDGTRATVLLLNGAIRDFNIAARVVGHGIVSTQFFMTPAPNETHSACLAGKIEQMYLTGSAPYSVQRTLLTTGILEASLQSGHRFNQRMETPQLAVSYQASADSQYSRT